MTDGDPRFWLRDGTPADAETWRRKQGDAAYVQVAKTTLAGGMWVSTLWLGVDDGSLRSEDGRPLLFETVVFDVRERRGIDRARWPDEASAVEGHEALVAKWSRQ